MTLEEKNRADLANANVKEVAGFSKAFRTSELNNLQSGESFVIPENYTVKQRAIGGNTENPMEYINVLTNTGRTVEFSPRSMTRVAFPVDESGKNIRENGRMKVVRSTGNLIPFIQGKEIDSTMKALKGCTIQYTESERVKTRAFGVPEEKATSNDVNTTIIGKWDLVGDKKPAGWAE